MHLFSNRSQRTSKCGKNISDTLGYTSCATFLFLPHFDVICDLLLNRCMATWNLFVNLFLFNDNIIIIIILYEIYNDNYNLIKLCYFFPLKFDNTGTSHAHTLLKNKTSTGSKSFKYYHISKVEANTFVLTYVHWKKKCFYRMS